MHYSKRFGRRKMERMKIVIINKINKSIQKLQIIQCWKSKLQLEARGFQLLKAYAF
jgi:hypothetical protein